MIVVITSLNDPARYHDLCYDFFTTSTSMIPHFSRNGFKFFWPMMPFERGQNYGTATTQYVVE